MVPTISDGDWLLVDFARRDARPGEIVLFESAAGLVVRRVIARRPTGPSAVLVTKGDGGLRCDARVPLRNVLGTVLRVRPGADYPVVTELRARVAAVASGSVAILAVRAARIPRPLRRRAYRLARAAVRIAAHS